METILEKRKPIYKRIWFWAIVLILVICFIIVIVNLEITNNTVQTSSNTQANTSIKKETEEEKQARLEKERIEREQKEAEEKIRKEQEEKDFKATCKTYTYKEIARNPNNYIGKPVKFTGEVIQVSEGYLNQIVIRLNITKDKYGYYEDTIYCEYTYSDGENKILEDDIITIYGTCQGDTSYTSVLGATITLPKVDIEYITIN